MANAYANLIKGTVFTCTNTDKAFNSTAGDNVVRALIACGQVTNAANSVFDIVGMYDNAIGNGIKEAGSALRMAKTNSTFLNTVGNVSNFAANNINPILCVASGVRVLNAKDKGSALIEEVGAMSAMFAGEAFAKRFLGLAVNPKTGVAFAGYQNIKCLAKLGQKFNTFCNTTKLFGKISLAPVPSIVKGVLFCAVSILAFSAGKKIASKIADKTTRKNYEEKQLAEANTKKLPEEFSSIA